MYFKHNADDTIDINGVKIDYETFLRVEPQYKKDQNTLWISYTPGDHHAIHTLDGNQLPGPLPWESGDRYISRLADFKIMQKEIDEENAKVKKEVATAPRKKNKKEQPKFPDESELIIALWEMIVEGKDDTEINKLQEQRDYVKSWRKKNGHG